MKRGQQIQLKNVKKLYKKKQKQFYVCQKEKN